MYSFNDCSHYFIERKEVPGSEMPDLIVSDEGAVNVTAEDLDFSGRTFRILKSPFEKSCYAAAHLEPDQVPDVIRILRKAYPSMTQVIFPRVRSGRKAVSDYGRVPPESKRAFLRFLEEKGISLERFILDHRFLIIIDGEDDILGDMIKNRLFDMDNVSVMENLNDREFLERFGGE